MEGRDRIVALRGPCPAPTDLHSTIRNVCEQADVPADVVVSSMASGKTLEVTEMGVQEIASIVAEALRNAIRHASPRRVDVRTIYSRKSVTIEIADDGIGIGADILKRGGKDGHWGVVGMRERAERLGAELTIVRGPHAGTVVSLRIPRLRLLRN